MPVRAIGLTPRLFKELVGRREANHDAVPAEYVPVIGRHVESVAPNKQVMAQNFVPVVVEAEGGERRVLHVDPLAVRKFRRAVAEELRCVQDKRQLMLGRMMDLRRELPPPPDRDVAAALEQEIAGAEARVGEPLLQPLPPSTRSLHVLVEATPCMAQLRLVCEYLVRELPNALAATGCDALRLAALGAGSRPNEGSGEWPPPALDGADLPLALQWLRQLGAAAGDPATGCSLQGGARRAGAAPGGFRLAPALRGAAEAGSTSGCSVTALLLACSPPSDLEACLAALGSGGNVVLQAVGVFGVSPEDPEHALQILADAAPQGSGLHLFFGAEYWRRFVRARQRRLERLRRSIRAEREARGPECEREDSDVVSPKILELRLIERIMRECYVEEQMYEKELVCAGRVLDRTLVDRDEVVAAIRHPALNSAAPEA